ncbi:hypothetical protein BOFE_06380 [Candidatus Borrelia fainii]|uniref:Uncharacterized protein n=1 Tax=Candidatus Borrelia fainii TaxID=2518322 RepID=A0ABN6URT7_9SPIR|nr:hypothetical protein BOFE_06380 [Candidatus Borrelia fainii]
MIEKAAAKEPYFTAKIPRKFLEKKEKIPTREEVSLKMVKHIKEYNENLSINTVLKHIMKIVFAKKILTNLDKS